VNPASKYENEGGPGFPKLMSLLAVSDDPTSDRDRLMRTACFVYLLAAPDAHAKNYSFLHTRGQERPSLRLAPLYDIASAWPYPRRIPVRKMKLAMRIGRHYRMQEIQLRHFEELAKTCSYPAERLRDSLQNLAERLPDEALATARGIRTDESGQTVLNSLVDKLAAQCDQMLSRLRAAH
jgi:serine/threonine-protein kinase HipA